MTSFHYIWDFFLTKIWHKQKVIIKLNILLVIKSTSGFSSKKKLKSKFEFPHLQLYLLVVGEKKKTLNKRLWLWPLNYFSLLNWQIILFFFKKQFFFPRGNCQMFNSLIFYYHINWSLLNKYNSTVMKYGTIIFMWSSKFKSPQLH